MKLLKLLKGTLEKNGDCHYLTWNFFFYQMERGDTQIDPFDYWFHSEDYFQKLCALKSTADILFPVKKKKNKKKYVKKYKPIR